MCAIAGILDLPYKSNMIDKLLSTMKRRGPDASGVYSDRNCCLLHSRLTIVDPNGGKQPMTLLWKGQKYCISYNGELYNTMQVKEELQAHGHVFMERSDTEVVLHAYAQWKDACVHKLNGIFAFAVWDENNQRLFLARDRMGVKPLFYKIHDGGMIFASEMKTILAYPTVKAKLDIDGVSQLLLLGPGRRPGSGVFQGINELMPGCTGVYQKGKWTWNRYWYLRDGEHTEGFEETAAHVRDLVINAVESQMISDMPLGTFLSGGLDSSLISAVCAKKAEAEGWRMSTFSLDFKENERYFVPGKFQPNSDPAYIRIMEEFLPIRPNWTCLTPEDLVGALEDATIARDLPGMADVDFSLLVFCSHIRREVKVALSGECADEIFGGYPWFRDPEIREKDGFPWAQNTSQRCSFIAQQYRQRIDAEGFVNACYRDSIEQADVSCTESRNERRIKQMVHLNYTWFMQTLLDRKDRMSMYNGLEVRVPFCDYRIAEYMYRVPWGMKEYGGFEKGLLRYAMQGILPDEILWRKKSPYPKTYDPRYLSLVSDSLQQLLEQNDAPLFQIVDRTQLKKLLNAEYTWPWYGQLMKVPQTIAYMLQINFWLTHYNVDIV